MIGGHEPAKARDRRQDQPDRDHRSDNSGVGKNRPNEFKAKAQENAGDHAHHDRHRNQLHDALDPAARTQHQHQEAGRVKRADHFRKRQMGQRLADDDGAGNGPEENQRLAVEPAEQRA